MIEIEIKFYKYIIFCLFLVFVGFFFCFGLLLVVGLDVWGEEILSGLLLFLRDERLDVLEYI